MDGGLGPEGLGPGGLPEGLPGGLDTPGAALARAHTFTLDHAVLAYAAAAVSGALIAACFLRFELFLLAWVAFVPLLWALQQAGTPRAAARIGLVAGLVTNIPAFYWLVYTIHVFGM